MESKPKKRKYLPDPYIPMEVNEVHLIGMAMSGFKMLSMPNGDRAMTFQLTTHDMSYVGLEYKKRIHAHTILLRDPKSIEAVSDAYFVNCMMEVFGSISYRRSLHGKNAEILAHMAIVRDDLRPLRGTLGRKSIKYMTDDDDSSEVIYDENGSLII